ncbi:MAG: TetR/AcrR family transcriptional regulator [Chloroflexi bacterium]|nr:TetR/AcrR family transcriptional regulator [Chloroflexota bacterium]
MATAVSMDRKKHIITSAMKLWQQAHNVNEVKLTDIAQEAGVPANTINKYFDTRAGLVHEVIRYLVKDILDKQEAILKSKVPFPEKMQRMISVKLKRIEGIELDLLDKICTDPVDRQYVEDMAETESKPMVKAIIKEGKRENYIRTDMPDEVIMLYFEILQSGGAVCSEEMKRIVADRNSMLALTRLIYFGIFQKEFDVNVNNTITGKGPHNEPGF